MINGYLGGLMDIDWIGALIGAGAGAVLTSFGAFLAYLLERRRIEQRALSELERDLSERRAFVVGKPVLVASARSSDDYDRLNRSVIAARENLRQTRAALVRRRREQQALTAMIQACNVFLEDSDRHPSRYWFFAATLRDTVHGHLKEIFPRRSDVAMPGSKALRRTPAVGGRP
jgi:hypothetical protein